MVVDLYELTGEKIRSDTVVKNLVGKQKYGDGFSFRSRVFLNDVEKVSVIGILQSGINVYSGDGYYFVFNGETGGLIKGAYGEGTNVSFVAEADVSSLEWQAEQGVLLEFGAYDGYTGSEKTHVTVYVSLNGERVLTYDDFELRAFGENVVASTYGTAVLMTTDELTVDSVTREDMSNVSGLPVRERYATGVCLGSSSVDCNYEFRANIQMYRNEEAVPIGIFQSRGDTWSGNGFYLIIDEKKGMSIADNAYGDSEQGGKLDIISPYIRATYEPIDVLFEEGGAEVRFGAYYVRSGEKILYTYVYATLNGERVLSWCCTETKPRGKYVVVNTYACCTMTTTRPMRNIRLSSVDGSASFDEGASFFSDVDAAIEFSVKAGFAVTGVKVDGATHAFEETEKGAKIVLPADFFEGENFVEVTTEEKTVSVFLPTGDGCEYLVNGKTESAIPWRGGASVMIVPPEGKKIASFLVNGEEKVTALVEENGKYYYNVSGAIEDMYLETLLADMTYAVTVTSSKGGSVTASTSIVEHGKSVTFAVTTDKGYAVKSVVLNGTEISLLADGTFTVEYCDKAQSLEVTFEKTATLSGCTAIVNFGDLSAIIIICGIFIFHFHKKANKMM